MCLIPERSEKCLGALLGSAIGDALGWPHERSTDNRPTGEFIQWKRLEGGRVWRHEEVIQPGEYSDDTQMILMVARSIISGKDWENFFANKELPFWLKYERGGGRMIKAAARCFEKGTVPWLEIKEDYFQSGANGAVMRILPHVIAQAGEPDTEKLMRDVVADSILTHGHPRAILGATCYAYALQAAMRKTSVLTLGELLRTVADGAEVWGKFPETAVSPEWLDIAKGLEYYNYEEEWSGCLARMEEWLLHIERTLQKNGLAGSDKELLASLGCFDKKINGAGDVTILAALYLASKYATRPDLGIKQAAYAIGSDTDTLAAITGGLLGMICGVDWIPREWQNVQDYECLVNFADLLQSKNMTAASQSLTSQAKQRGGNWKNSPIGRISYLDYTEYRSGKTGKITVSRYKTLLGQTIYLRKQERIKETDRETDRARNQKLVPGATAEEPIFFEDPIFAVSAAKRRAMVLDTETIPFLRQSYNFSKISLEKALQLIFELSAVSCNNSEISEIAKRNGVETALVNALSSNMVEVVK